jgi:hypothetical protein
MKRKRGGNKQHNMWRTFSNSLRKARTAFSLSVTSSSRYWYRNFFLARHSRALCLLRSVKCSNN